MIAATISAVAFLAATPLTTGQALSSGSSGGNPPASALSADAPPPDPGAPSASGGEVQELRERLETVEGSLARTTAELQRVSSLMGERSTDILTAATLLTTVTAFFFSGLVVVLGWVTYERHKEIREELRLRRQEIVDAGGLLSEQRQTLTDDYARLASQIEVQRRDTQATRLFVQQVAEGFFSSTLLEILGALRDAGALATGTDVALRTKVKEVEARLFLWHGDKSRVDAAVRALSALGTPAAVPDLKRLLASEATDELKDLALQAILKIERRRGARRPPKRAKAASEKAEGGRKT